ncbi:hypothetical protein [Leadbettera azotonutricia]|uniref:hypothetical protein n=1 Tax=Leadbettera azotonutricia TaxID=150829 RepID=UPI0002D2F5E6|nr:hypothetical protein [Leadbettera azotonutricia]
MKNAAGEDANKIAGILEEVRRELPPAELKQGRILIFLFWTRRRRSKTMKPKPHRRLSA